MVTTNKRYIVGLTGTNAAGKGEVGLYLKSKGYRFRSLSDILRVVAEDRHQEPSREVMINLGNELREKEGPATLAVRTVAVLTMKNYVIDSIRNPSEVEELSKAGEFLLISVDAPIDIRYERSKSRGRIENADSLAAFQAIENQERSTAPTAQQLHACMEMADIHIDNGGTLEQLHKNVQKALEEKDFPS